MRSFVQIKVILEWKDRHLLKKRKKEEKQSKDIYSVRFAYQLTRKLVRRLFFVVCLNLILSVKLSKIPLFDFHNIHCLFSCFILFYFIFLFIYFCFVLFCLITNGTASHISPLAKSQKYLDISQLVPVEDNYHKIPDQYPSEMPMPYTMWCL